MRTRLGPSGLHEEILSPYRQLAEASLPFDNLAARINSVEVSPDRQIQVASMDLARYSFEVNAQINVARQNLGAIVVDTFKDLSGIDWALSSQELEHNQDFSTLQALPSFRWESITPSTSPPTTAKGAMAYDQARQKIVFWSPSVGTWEFDVNTLEWSHVNVPEEPTGSNDYDIAYDKARGVTVLLYGSGTWEYDGSSWVRNEGAVLGSQYTAVAVVLAYDEAHKEVILAGSTAQSSPRLHDRTWSYDGVTWTLLPPDVFSRLPGYDQTYATGYTLDYHPGVGSVLLYGGYEYSPGVYRIRFSRVLMLSHDRSSWIEMPNFGEVLPRDGHAAESRGPLLVAYGGASDDSATETTLTAYDGLMWHILEQAGPIPPGGSGNIMIHAPDLNQTFLYRPSTAEMWLLAEDQPHSVQVVTVPEHLDRWPSSIYVAPYIPDNTLSASSDYLIEASLDNGSTWFPVPHKMITLTPSSPFPGAEASLRVKVTMPKGALLGGLAVGWL